jgi:hypothetical protein
LGQVVRWANTNQLISLHNSYNSKTESYPKLKCFLNTRVFLTQLTGIENWSSDLCKKDTEWHPDTALRRRTGNCDHRIECSGKAAHMVSGNRRGYIFSGKAHPDGRILARIFPSKNQQSIIRLGCHRQGAWNKAVCDVQHEAACDKRWLYQFRLHWATNYAALQWYNVANVNESSLKQSSRLFHPSFY